MAAESEKERLNRKLEELLQELRVALPGVQVLFAFLLTIPFTGRFAKITDLQRDVYFTAFLATAVASALLIAPSAYHRIRWRYLDKETLDQKRRMLVTGGRFAATGFVFLGVATTAVVYLVTDVLFGSREAAVIGAALASVLVWLWYALPLSRRMRDR